MSKVIHKCEVTELPIHMPYGARILTLQVQNNKIVMWVLVDPNQKEEEVHQFRIYGTGWELPDNPGKYVGTVQQASIGVNALGMMVWHIFEEESK